VKILKVERKVLKVERKVLKVERKMLKVERKMKVLLLVAQFAGVVEVLTKLCCFLVH
jgi:hypothetical protein